MKITPLITQLCDHCPTLAGRVAAGIDLETLQVSTPRVVDEGRSVDPGRMAGNWQVDILKSHTHELKSDMLGVPSGAGSVAPDALFNQGPSSLGFTEVTEVTEVTEDAEVTEVTEVAEVAGVTGVTGVTGGIETRPRNVAYPGRIKLI